MAASTKTAPSESAPRGNRQNRRREISGILLLAGGLFAGHVAAVDAAGRRSA